jgi:hypothetical protein
VVVSIAGQGRLLVKLRVVRIAPKPALVKRFTFSTCQLCWRGPQEVFVVGVVSWVPRQQCCLRWREWGPREILFRVMDIWRSGLNGKSLFVVEIPPPLWFRERHSRRGLDESDRTVAFVEVGAIRWREEMRRRRRRRVREEVPVCP